MARPSDSLDTHLMSKVSTLYYHQEYTQQQIADKMQLSRPKVSRLLKQAREHGIVKISIDSPEEYFVELETHLEEQFNLLEAVVVDADRSAFEDPDGRFLKKQIGIGAAKYLQRTINEGEVIGVTWGTSLQAMVESMQPIQTNGVHIVQILGGVGPPEAKAHSADIARRLSQLMDAQLTLLPAPGIVGNPESREVLTSDPKVQSATDLFPDITKALVGIGALETNPFLVEDDDELTPRIRREIIDSRAVGDIALRFFDQNGQLVDTSLNDRLIGISVEQLLNVPCVMGIAGGKPKVEPILASLRGRFVDVLITDQFTAEELLLA